MKCRKAFELNLADFVVDSRSDARAAFREHYPGCEDCAAEVAVWDEMQAFLRSGVPGATTAHPPKELLLRYEEHRDTLSAIEAAMLGKHLATCRTCPDELAALRAFDFSVVRRQPSSGPQPWWTLVRDAVARIRPVVLHPVFAYALVLILLYPTLLQLRVAGGGRQTEQIALESRREPRDVRQRAVGDSDQHEDVASPPSAERIAVAKPPAVGSVRTKSLAWRADDLATGDVASETTPPTNGRAQLAASARPRRAASRHSQPAESITENEAAPDRVVDDTRAGKTPPAADRKKDPYDEIERPDGSDSLAHGEPADEDSDEPRVLGFAETEEPHDHARHAQRVAQDNASDASWPTIVLAPGRTPAVQRTDLGIGIVLRLPPADRDVEILVVGPDSRNVARETVISSSAPVEIRIRTTGFVNGTYRVLMRRLDGSVPSEETSELTFIVR